MPPNSPGAGLSERTTTPPVPLSPSSNGAGPPRSAQPVGEEWDPIHEKVLGALSDERWDFRTAEGIAEDIGISPDDAHRVLLSHPVEVRVSRVPDSEGRVLYRLRSRGKPLKERIAEAQVLMADSFGS